MKLGRRSLIKGIGAAGITLQFAGFASASDGRARYIVRAGGPAADVVEDEGFEVLNELAGDRILLVKGPSDGADRLEQLDEVEEAVRDFAVEFEDPAVEADRDDAHPGSPDETYDEYQWDKQLQRVREAREYATGAGRTIAIIDTGVDDEHPDLDVDVEQSATIRDGRVDPHTGDASYHGTHVAGIAAASGNERVAGTAPDATLVSVRVLYTGSDDTFGDIMVGMEYAGEVGADAANISLGAMSAARDAGGANGAYRRMYEPVANEMRRNGTLLVGSGGNDDTNLQGGWLRLWNGLAGAIGVSATGPNDELTFYSNYGTNDIDVGAPGGGYETYEKTVDPDADVEWPYPLNLVFSTLPGGSYGWLAGTSMAAPQVTGLAALVRELDPDATSQQVVDAIKKGAEGADGQGDSETGAGRVNALNTVERLR